METSRNTPQPKKEDDESELCKDTELITKAAKGGETSAGIIFPFTPAQEFAMLEIDGETIPLRDPHSQTSEGLGIWGLQSARSLQGQVSNHLALSFNHSLFSDCKIQTATESLFLHRIVLSSSPVLAEALALDVSHLENGSRSANEMPCLGLQGLVG